MAGRRQGDEWRGGGREVNEGTGADREVKGGRQQAVDKQQQEEEKDIEE